MSASETTDRVFEIDLSAVSKDSIVSASELQSFILDRVQRKFKYCSAYKSISVDGNSSKVTVSSGGLFTKPYLRFLLKNFIGKKQIHEWVRVQSDGVDGFAYKYFSEDPQ